MSETVQVFLLPTYNFGQIDSTHNQLQPCFVLGAAIFSEFFLHSWKDFCRLCTQYWNLMLLQSGLLLQVGIPGQGALILMHVLDLSRIWRGPQAALGPDAPMQGEFWSAGLSRESPSPS